MGEQLAAVQATDSTDACEPSDGQSPYLPELDPLRAQAVLELLNTTEALGEYTRAIAAWQSAAWNGVLRVTGGNALIGLTSAEWHELFMSPLGKGLGGLDASAQPRESHAGRTMGAAADVTGNAALASGVAAVGSAATKKAGDAGLRVLLAAFAGTGVPGFVLNVLVNALWSVISDLLSDGADKKAHEAVERAIDQRQQLESGINQETARVHQEWNQRRASIERAIFETRSGAELELVKSWLQSNRAALAPPPLDPQILTKKLLHHWFLQHAGDEEDVNAETSEYSYEQVRTTKGHPDELERRDLFIHQAKYAWGRLGVDLDAPVALLRSRLKAAEATGADATAISASLDGMTVRLSSIRSPTAFATNLPPSATLLGPAISREEDLVGAAERHTFELTCRLDLTDEDGAVFINALEYDLRPKAGFDANEGTCSDEHDPRGFIGARHWSYSPD